MLHSLKPTQFLDLLHHVYHQHRDLLFHNPYDRAALKMNASTEIDGDGSGEGRVRERAGGW